MTSHQPVNSSSGIQNIDHSISQILFTVTSVADGVDNMQTRLDEALADLDKPIVRIADEMSDLHIALKGTMAKKPYDLPELTSSRKREERAPTVAFYYLGTTTLQGNLGICTPGFRGVAFEAAMLRELEGFEYF